MALGLGLALAQALGSPAFLFIVLGSRNPRVGVRIRVYAGLG